MEQKYQVRFTPDWRNSTMKPVGDLWDTPLDAMNYLIKLLDEHYARQWRINTGTDFVGVQVIHVQSKGGDNVLGMIVPIYSRRETLMKDIAALNLQIAELEKSRNQLQEELEALEE